VAPAVRPFAIAASTPDNGQETHQTDEHTAVR